MTCKDVMTANPKFCVPDDPVARAAEIMRVNDVGAVPVVRDHAGKRLGGMITDRDIAIKIVATGRDPRTTRIEEVMSKGIVICRTEDDCRYAIDAMARHQVRRVPVVDAEGALIGIISQADIARQSSQEETGEVLENISRPRGFAHTVRTRMTPRSWRYSAQGSASTPGAFLLGTACIGLGAGIMYLLDPNRGRSRRARVQSKTVGLYKDLGNFATKAQRDLQNRATGLMAEAKAKFRPQEQVDDDILEARVRSKLGHVMSHSRAISIEVKKGSVTLNGSVPADVIDDVISGARSVPGVVEVISNLRAPGTFESSASSGAAVHGRRDRSDFARNEMSPMVRLAASAIGGTLAIYGLRRHGALAKAAGTLGVGLIATGMSKKDARVSALSL
jgi:CBS domain-containing protein/osmotically-inducible protein OsmY